MLDIFVSGLFWLPFLAYLGPFAGLVYVVVFVTFEFLVRGRRGQEVLHEDWMGPQRFSPLNFIMIFKGIFMVFAARKLCSVLGPPFWRRYFASKGSAGHVEGSCMSVAGSST